MNCKLLNLSLFFSSHVSLLSVFVTAGWCCVRLFGRAAVLWGFAHPAFHITHSEAKCQWLQDAQHLSGIVALLLKESKLPFPYDNVCDFNEYDRALFKNTYYLWMVGKCVLRILPQSSALGLPLDWSCRLGTPRTAECQEHLSGTF